MANKYTKQNWLWKLKLIFPKDFIKRKSKEHFNQIILNRWKYVAGKKLLDAGSGYGEFINLNPNNIEVYGMEMKSSKDSRVKSGDLNKKIPYQNNSFDCVASFHVLEHLKEPEAAIKEFKRVLKNKGRLIITVPNLSLKNFFKDHTHIRPYPKNALYNILASNGFKNIKIIRGHFQNKIINIIFFPFPKLRWNIEKTLGKILSPYEITAVAECEK